MEQDVTPRLSIIIPVLDEAAVLPGLLASLVPFREAGDEVIVADGGSRDGTPASAARRADRVVGTPPGRARQMNAGAARACGGMLWFLHADSRLTPGCRDALLDAVDGGAAWGRFDVRLSGDRWLYRVIAAAMNTRSRWTGIATGDQGLFVDAGVFRRVGGFPEQPLMEDIALSARLRRVAPPWCAPGPLVTSSRRWERNGAWRTIALMWRLRLAYRLGADPQRLHRRYYRSGDAP
ncbi:TIGR04283 family arsenosugar biosynthesis glycosyltransferase [Arhodomonas aquaeolei]|uniref:TIGR04283 family arsenosugar biosynthesis glycosyltransferase n=1 Tax=Arhodomonas aquaeolei TaxID=2369 RepID=UPI0004769F11|nr:TIGR04283 family arsenosugar biosynthesis glycosyltransferase [Arhodomonas aquaeolei]MCS4503846.1 TIGR04283 family arsenosugar biosynthesis glycosyltransferase [Arhodomonas aquaeolei]